MKYKVGDKVRVRKDLNEGMTYNEVAVTTPMTDKAGDIVTISAVSRGYYHIAEYGCCWTDEMFEGLAEEELTAEEAIKIQAEICSSTMCKDCEIEKLRYGSYCNCIEFRSKNSEKVIEILKQRKKEHEKKPIETESVGIVRVIEDTGDIKKCVYEEELAERENPMDAKERVLKEYCQNHAGKFFTVFESICRVKE